MSNSAHACTESDKGKHTLAYTHLVHDSPSKDAACLMGVGMILGCCQAVVCLVAVLAHLGGLQWITYLPQNYSDIRSTELPELACLVLMTSDPVNCLR